MGFMCCAQNFWFLTQYISILLFNEHIPDTENINLQYRLIGSVRIVF
jgi:hypothetical protein